jgi:hypothetical protein
VLFSSLKGTQPAIGSLQFAQSQCPSTIFEDYYCQDI